MILRFNPLWNWYQRGIRELDQLNDFSVLKLEWVEDVARVSCTRRIMLDREATVDRAWSPFN